MAGIRERVSPDELGSEPDVFLPELGMLLDETSHDLHATLVLGNHQLDPSTREQVLGTEEGPILSDQDAGDPKEQSGTRAHDTRAKRRYESQAIPVPSATGIADTDDLGMSSRITGLNPEVVAGCDDLTVGGRQHGTDRDPALGTSDLRLLERCS